MLQLLEKGPLFILSLSTLNHLGALRVKANTELIQMPLHWRSSFKRTHKSICACVCEYGNASPSHPFSSLMRNIPWVMALAASKMGNPYLPRGHRRVRGKKVLCRERTMCMCDFSGSKVLHILSFSLCLCRALGKHEWVDIYKRCRATQGRGVFWWVHVGWKVGYFSWNCLFLYWIVICRAAPSTLFLRESYIHKHCSLFHLSTLCSLFSSPTQPQWSFPWKAGASIWPPTSWGR